MNLKLATSKGGEVTYLTAGSINAFKPSPLMPFKRVPVVFLVNVSLMSSACWLGVGKALVM